MSPCVSEITRQTVPLPSALPRSFVRGLLRWRVEVPAGHARTPGGHGSSTTNAWSFSWNLYQVLQPAQIAWTVRMMRNLTPGCWRINSRMCSDHTSSARDSASAPKTRPQFTQANVLDAFRSRCFCRALKIIAVGIIAGRSRTNPTTISEIGMVRRACITD